MSKPHHRRLLSMLGLAPSVVRSLQDANLLHDEDVRDLTLTDLQEVSSLQVSECCEVLRLASGATAAAAAANTFTVLDMIESSPEVGHIVTLSSSLDSLLGGGLPLRAVTEVAGTPGAGKTQLCLQAAVSVQLPAAVGGVGGEAVILDAEGSVAATRIQEMAEYAVAHYKRVSEEGDCDIAPTDVDSCAHFTTESILRRIHYYRCLSQLSVVACIKLLPALLRDHPNIKLVVIDSIAFHLRHDVPDNRVRTGLLCSMTQDLVQLATRHHLAVLVTNQMTTRITPNTINSTLTGGSTGATIAGEEGFSTSGNGIGGSSSCLIPALGESWGHCPTVRLVLRWQQGVRTASLLKAPHAPHGTASFQVTAAGIRDVAAQDPQPGPLAPPHAAQEKGSSTDLGGGGKKRRRLSCVE